MVTSAVAGPLVMTGSIVRAVPVCAKQPGAHRLTMIPTEIPTAASARFIAAPPASVVPGIRLDGVLPAVAAGLLLGLVNAVVRPVLLILTLPITLVTLGLFLFVLNGLCLWLVASVVKGFHVAGFWPAVLGALCVSVVSWVVTVLVSDSGRFTVITRRF